MRMLKPIEMQKAMREGVEASEMLDALLVADLEKAKKDGHLNPDNTFKGGFKGCVSHQEGKGLSGESARKLCAYIGRKSGKIP